MEQDALLQILRAIAPALAGGIGSALLMGWLYRGMSGEAHIKTPNEEIFTYSARTKKFMIGLGVCCLVFAIGSLVMIGMKYYGSDPALPSQSCYRPIKDWLGGLGLFAGFGLGSIACLVDPIKYFAKIDKNGITIRGLFSGVRSLRWADIQGVKSHDSFQMISIRGRDKTGAIRRLWVPHYVSGFAVLMERLSQRDLFFKEQKEEIDAIKSYLS